MSQQDINQSLQDLVEELFIYSFILNKKCLIFTETFYIFVKVLQYVNGFLSAPNFCRYCGEYEKLQLSTYIADFSWICVNYCDLVMANSWRD